MNSADSYSAVPWLFLLLLYGLGQVNKVVIWFISFLFLPSLTAQVLVQIQVSILPLLVYLFTHRI